MSETDPEPTSRRRYAVMAAKIAVSLALLALLFTRVDAAELWAGARKASLVWLLTALAIYAVNIATSAWRWHVLLQAQRIQVPGARVLGSFLVATFFNN